MVVGKKTAVAPAFWEGLALHLHLRNYTHNAGEYYTILVKYRAGRMLIA